MTDDQLRTAVQLGGTLATLATLAFGIWQYRTAQLWRKKELIAKETKEFFTDPLVKTAMRLIDWHAFKIDLPRPDLPESERRVMTVVSLNTAPGDMGKIIGRQGRTAAALRTLVALTAEKHGLRATLDIRD